MKHILFLLSFFAVLALPCFAQDLLLNEAMRLYSDGDYQAAVNAFGQVLKDDSSDVRAMRYLGYSLQNLEKHKTALEALSQASKLLPNDIPLQLAIARSYAVMGQPEMAELYYRAASAIDTTKLLPLARLGQFLFEERQWGKAQVILQRHLNLDPANSLVLLRLGTCEWNMGNSAEAAAILQTALTLAQENSEVVNQLSVVYLQMEMLESALKVLDVGLKHHKRDTRFHKRKGDILFKQREFKEAADAYARALELGDTSAGTWRSLGACHFFLEHYAQAMVMLKESGARDESEALTPYYMGLVWQKTGQQDSSVSYFEKAIMLSRAKFIADALTHMSVSYEEKGDLAQAIASLKRGMSLTPDNKVFLFYLASLYDRHYADRSIAKKYYEEFVRTASETEEPMVRQALGRLKVLKEEEHFRGN